MSETSINLNGATLYRLAFFIFAFACLMNAFDAYTSYIRMSFNLSPLVANPRDMINETWAFMGLAAILVLEAVGLMMFKWVKRAAVKLI